MNAVLGSGKYIKDDKNFAEAYSRVLTILTRHRNLALQLAQKEHLTAFSSGYPIFRFCRAFLL